MERWCGKKSGSRKSGWATRLVFAMALIFLVAGCARAQAPAEDSGGPLLPEQAAYDVTYYDLALSVDPAAHRIQGTLTAHARATDSLGLFVLDLDERLSVERVTLAEGDQPLDFERRGGRLWITLPRPVAPGSSLAVAVAYEGTPRTAPNPPWEGGFTWAETPGGQPWIATSAQTVGADMWWPDKDHPSDEPDSMRLRFTVPRPDRKGAPRPQGGSTLRGGSAPGVRPLVAASNGRLRGVTETDSTRTYDWFVSTPIQPYAVTLNAAPYVRLDTTYRSTAGTDVPVAYYVLPADSAAALRARPALLDQVRFFEETLGPYPFRADKIGLAQTPFLGMEHQTLIAHGPAFGQTDALGYEAGFDALYLHELAHEWFGNLATAADWKDFWLHEGFATYMEVLYAEHLDGVAGRQRVMQHVREEVEGGQPIVRREATSAQQMYIRDVYFKGASVLHTLRYLIGDDTFFRVLRRAAYPADSLEQITDGRQTHLATTADLVRLAEEESGQLLGWFFDVYLYDAELPRLVTERAGTTLTLRWEAPDDFPMPVPVRVDGAMCRVEMPGGTATIQVPEGAAVAIDPENWLTRQ